MFSASFMKPGAFPKHVMTNGIDLEIILEQMSTNYK